MSLITLMTALCVVMGKTLVQCRHELVPAMRSPGGFHRPSCVNRFVGESERALHEVFADASQRAPSLIIFDEIDTLCPRREEATSEAQRRVVSTMLALLDGISSQQQVRLNLPRVPRVQRNHFCALGHLYFTVMRRGLAVNCKLRHPPRALPCLPDCGFVSFISATTKADDLVLRAFQLDCDPRGLS